MCVPPEATSLRVGRAPEPPADHVGGFVRGALTADREVIHAEPLYCAFHELDDRVERWTDGEAYGTVYQFPPEVYWSHVRRHGSPKGYAGPAACSRLPFDIDRADDLAAAVADARTLYTFLEGRYGDGVGVYFSGSKGFHLSIVSPAGFTASERVPDVAKLLATTIASKAGVRIDPAIYDRQRVFRLPNSRHRASGLYKRYFDVDELFGLDADGFRRAARHPAGTSPPTPASVSVQLAEDWHQAASYVATARPFGSSGRVAPSFCPVVPQFVRDAIGFADWQEPGRAVTLFRCAAALSEAFALHGADAVIRGLLEEPALKMGLTADEVVKQLRDGIAHVRKAVR
ncbi:hypothetical protein [Limnoglobus roseus]|uniref:DNA primase n=1 Tax=Limnoglobus roseus TaxID=2598579 RepID=A0A5C1AIZ3_9BACT|nr:hypothetical protein [Limnoglobus roseus]QEL19131.1 DNA primase [Limnoglobus roseus]